ncbi:hypothetical protein ACOI9R_32740, partial [Mesorhizobium japonicum]
MPQGVLTSGASYTWRALAQDGYMAPSNHTVSTPWYGWQTPTAPTIPAGSPAATPTDPSVVATTTPTLT